MSGYTFISGATGGIGKAFCHKVGESGNNMFLTGRSEEKLSALKEELSKYGVDVKYFACNLTVENDRTKMMEYIDGLGIKFDALINVAGVDTQKAFTEYTKDKLLFQLRVNAEATVSLTYDILARRNEEFSIITISSMSGVSPMPYFALYSATKCMLTNLFTALHYELKKQNVKVTVVLPGGVPTRPDIIKEIKSQGFWGKLTAKPPEFVVEKSLKALKKNKIKCIPGFFNKFLFVLMKIAPKRIVLSYIARRWRTHSKDAF